MFGRALLTGQILTAPQNISFSGNVRKTGLQNTSEKQVSGAGRNNFVQLTC